MEKATRVQTKDNDGLEQRGNNRHGEKWLSLEIYFENQNYETC